MWQSPRCRLYHQSTSFFPNSSANHCGSTLLPWKTFVDFACSWDSGRWLRLCSCSYGVVVSFRSLKNGTDCQWPSGYSVLAIFFPSAGIWASWSHDGDWDSAENPWFPFFMSFHFSFGVSLYYYYVYNTFNISLYEYIGHRSRCCSQ